MSFGAGAIMQGLGAGIGVGEYVRGAYDPTIKRGYGQGIASELYKFLMERLRTNPVDTDSYLRYSTALQEGLRDQMGAGIQGLTETAQARGFQDSGEVLAGVQDIRRGGLRGFASGTRDILEMLESRRLEGVLPFLGMAVGEHDSRANQQLQRTGQAISSLQSGGQGMNQSASGAATSYFQGGSGLA